MSQEAIHESRTLYNSRSSGVLSTISVKLEGYPFGSVVPYSLDQEGNAVVLISTIAQHTKNISADPRCSLMILSESDDVQANSRLCIVGDMQKLPADDTATIARYYRHFPKSKGYHEAHDFSFYRLLPVSIRYIGGFGKIHWLNPEDFKVDNPFHGKGETYIVDHMNEDHQKDLRLYCEYYKGLQISDETITMAGIDPHGFDVFINDRKVRFSFEEPIGNAQEARMRLVALSKAAKSDG